MRCDPAVSFARGTMQPRGIAGFLAASIYFHSIQPSYQKYGQTDETTVVMYLISTVPYEVQDE